MGLRDYRATRLPSYTATRIGKQRGARNGTPRHSWSLLLFSPERFLNLFLILLLFILIRPNIGTPARAHDIGELAIVGCCVVQLSYYWTTELHGYRATRLRGYTDIGLQSYSRSLATYRYPHCAQPRENHPSGHRWQSWPVRTSGREILNGYLPLRLSHPMRW